MPASAGSAARARYQPRTPARPGQSGRPHVLLHYDGTTWSPIVTGADPEAQQIVVFDEGDLWVFVRTPIPPPPIRMNDLVSAAQHTVGRREDRWQWQAVDWPFTDIISVHSMVRAAPGEYWAAAYYGVLPERAENFRWGLLHFVDGTWREYPRR
jgi:hypothetical protein